MFEFLSEIFGVDMVVKGVFFEEDGETYFDIHEISHKGEELDFQVFKEDLLRAIEVEALQFSEQMPTGPVLVKSK